MNPYAIDGPAAVLTTQLLNVTLISNKLLILAIACLVFVLINRFPVQNLASSELSSSIVREI